jgi:hypothetical protein
MTGAPCLLSRKRNSKGLKVIQDLKCGRPWKLNEVKILRGFSPLKLRPVLNKSKQYALGHEKLQT